MQKDFNKKVHSYKEQLNEIRKKVAAKDEKVAKKVKKYWSYFTEMMVTAAEKKPKQVKDLHNKELSILNQANQQILTHRTFGAALTEMLTEVKKLESIRLEAVKQSFSLYMNKMAKLFGETGLASEIVRFLEQLGTKKEVQTVFALPAILSPEELAEIHKIMRLDANKLVTEENINAFLQMLEYELPSSKPLVQKEWNAQRESGLLRSLKPCKVVITIEDNILLIDTSDGKEYKKADQTIRLENVNVSPTEAAKKKKNPLFVEIEESKPGFLGGKNKYVFKFNSYEEIDEFYYYVKISRN